MDVAASAVGLVVAAPVLLACALIVRREVGPGPLFRQERVGLDGRTFSLLKLRTMRPDADSDVRWHVEDGVGPVGGWLRRLSLDELPQLWNVLRGEMSLVGPRPERPHFVEQFTLDYDDYLWRHGFRSASPGGRRCTGCGATPPSPSGPASTTTTSRTGRCGWT